MNSLQHSASTSGPSDWVQVYKERYTYSTEFVSSFKHSNYEKKFGARGQLLGHLQALNSFINGTNVFGNRLGWSWMATGLGYANKIRSAI